MDSASAGDRLLTHEVRLLQGGNDTRLGRRRDDSHRVALSFDPLELLCDTRALLALGRELLRHLVKLTSHELILLLLAHREVVLLLQSDEHVAEVVPDEVFEKGVDIVGDINVVLLHHLIGEIGTCFEGETLGLAEGVVTVEEDVFNLTYIRISVG